MRCPLQRDDTAGLLLDYSARRLNEDAAAALELHMELCPECRRFDEQQRALWMALDAWEPADVSADFQRRFWASAAEAERRRWWTGISWKPAVPVAAVCALFVVGALQSTSPPEPASDRAEAEQVEQVIADLDLLAQLQSR